MRTCEIKWIDKVGQPTPDTNPAIGRVKLPSRIVQVGGRGVHFIESDWFNICACHAVQLSEPGMLHWKFELFPDDDLVRKLTDVVNEIAAEKSSCS